MRVWKLRSWKIDLIIVMVLISKRCLAQHFPFVDWFFFSVLLYLFLIPHLPIPSSTVMEVNFSLSCNASFSIQPPPTINTVYDVLYYCLGSRLGAFSFTAYTIINILVVLPLSVFILYLCHKQWLQQCSSTRMSHSDIFTYHMVIMELLNIFGSILCCCGVHTYLKEMLMLGIYLLPFNFCGQMLFHILTCVERYLAVIHPIIYLHLKNADGIRIRNVMTVFVWLLCFLATACMSMVLPIFNIMVTFCFVPFALIVISFCSISVLCTLINPVPAKEGRKRQRVDQTKLRAFCTIMIILGVLVLRFGGNILITIVYDALKLKEASLCGVWLLNLCVCVPCSLVLPLLFLYRAGKLYCCKSNNKSGNE